MHLLKWLFYFPFLLSSVLWGQKGESGIWLLGLFLLTLPRSDPHYPKGGAELILTIISQDNGNLVCKA